MNQLERPERPDLAEVPIAHLQQRCAEESDRFFRRQPSDGRFCYELLRRAVVLADQAAWAAVYNHYQPLVLGWVTRHPAFRHELEEASFFINRAFERFWTALAGERFEEFQDLGGVLRYLQLCVHSVIIDEQRRSQREQHLSLNTELHVGLRHALPSPAEHHETNALWQILESRLNDARERRVAYASFFLDLRPREIYAESTDLFKNIGEVYRIKENLIARLRRDREIQALVSGDA